MNTSTQLKALIRNLSKEKSVQAEIILRNFMLERAMAAYWKQDMITWLR